MKKSILIILVAIIATACGGSKTNIVFEQRKVEYQGSNEDRSVKIDIVYPIAVDSSNTEKGQLIVDAINNGVQKSGVFTPILSDEKTKFGADVVIAEAKKMLADSINYENICNWEGVRNDKIVSFLFTSYYYTGGAHGGTELRNATFDLNSGKELPLIEQISDTTQFLKIFLEHYYKQNNLTPKTPKEDVAYLVPLNELGMPSILYLTEEGFVGAYAQYEVAAYVVGITKATIPYEQLNGILKLNVKGLKKIETAK